MKAVVVYESLWGNTAAIARAIAEGIGPAARALPTALATPAVIADTDLIVAGAPVLGFSLPSEQMRESIRTSSGNAPTPPDLTQPSLRSWLAALPRGAWRVAAFETRMRLPLPGGATAAIMRELERAGGTSVGKPMGFFVAGRYGPLRDGETERARRWGGELAELVTSS